jgi:hypothetical protein
MISTAGFLEPDPDVFRVGTPVFTINGSPVGESGALESWDYSSELGISWELEIDKMRLLEECGLGPSTDIRLGFRWRSTKTTLYESTLHQPLVNGRNALRVVVPSELAGGTLVISLYALVMSVQPHECSPLAANRPGSILWADSRSVHLEGVGSRFPLVAVDFPVGEMQKGMWEFAPSSTDLESSALGSFNLRVNSAHPAIRKLLDTPGAAESKVLLATLKADLHRQLITWALREGAQIKSFEQDTIGGVLWTTFQRYFPESDFDEMSTSMQSSPWRVEGRIQAVTAEAVK